MRGGEKRERKRKEKIASHNSQLVEERRKDGIVEINKRLEVNLEKRCTRMYDTEAREGIDGTAAT